MPHRPIDEILRELKHAIRYRYGHRIVEVRGKSASGRLFVWATDEMDGPLDNITPDTPRRPEENRSGVEAEPLAVRVLNLLHDKGCRMTTTRLMTALSRAGIEYSERPLQNLLARLVEEGTLDNRQDARPAGYGFPEWESTCGDSAREHGRPS